MAERNSQLMAERICAHEKIEFDNFFGRTDLRVNLSGTKFDEEADFDVRSAVAPQKSRKLNYKQNFRSEISAKKMFGVEE